ncbi:hypothetical protein BDQ12DRAFT_727247 [Crucibulum laeve]|uniref:Uncharacterized protein n=1 Tax=Crucibulum laeve TaxID=68775 RepID=A0A5C3LZ52_9AGAR|nr:hypothetical protein BDQ12DRAFT_727247 [Crucibulum laeve]
MSTPSIVSHNPFRSNAATPNATGTSASSGPPSFTSTPGAGETPVNGHGSRTTNLASSNAAASSSTNALDVTSSRPPPRSWTPEEEPPAYTPAPDVYQGETTVEYGPRRPFQPPPVPPPQSQSPQHTGYSTSSGWSQNQQSRPGQGQGQSLWQQITGQLSDIVNAASSASLSQGSAYNASPQHNSQWSAYPGQQQQPPPQRQPTTPRPYSSFLPPPPPRHPSSSTLSVASEPSPHSPPSSDFARDFYAAGPNLPGQGEFSPPSGPPPSTGSTPRPPTSPARSHGRPEDEGKPTRTPVPGRPLLKDGKTLVYPKGYECDKCHNTGYKHFDPTHPCKKCWSKYSKPFSGPLVYAFAPSSPNSPSHANTNLQRPLPRTIGPRSTPQPPGGYPPRPPPSPYVPIPPPAPMINLPPMPSMRSMGPMTVYTPGRPPPGAVVYSAGDPRIGGRLCYRCGGKGTVSFMIIDRETCEVCGGSGRVFN